MSGFEHAFQRLMSRAPGPVFPRARRLYFDKYPLEAATASGPFRTFLFEESIDEGSDGSLTIHAHAFALVPWDPELDQAASSAVLSADLGVRYLQEEWQREATGITTSSGPWFRTDCAYLKVMIDASYCSRPGPGGPEAAPDRP